MGFGWRSPDKAIQAETRSREAPPHELNISRAPVFLRLLFLREKQVREGDSGQSMGNARYEMSRIPNILHSSYALKTRISFRGPVFHATTLGSFIIPK